MPRSIGLCPASQQCRNVITGNPLHRRCGCGSAAIFDNAGGLTRPRLFRQAFEDCAQRARTGDALRLYATKLLKAKDGDWRCTGCDPEGHDLRLGRTGLRLRFPQRVTGPGSLRAVLKELAEQARAAS
jgi:hypothetical protein